MITPTVIVAPTIEPVTLEEVEMQCRIDSATERNLVWLYMVAARKHVENLTGRAIMEQTLEWCLDQWPSGDNIVLPRATPLISISSIKYKDSDGIETTWDLSEYIADTDSIPGRVVLGYSQSWPSFTAYPVSPIRIRYKAGLADASPTNEPDETIRLAIMMLVGALFENRESIVVPVSQGSVQRISTEFGIDAFLAQHVASYVF